VADAFAIKVNVGLGGDGDVIDFLGGHGEILGRMSRPTQPGGHVGRNKTLDFRRLQGEQEADAFVSPCETFN